MEKKCQAVCVCYYINTITSLQPLQRKGRGKGIFPPLFNSAWSDWQYMDMIDRMLDILCKKERARIPQRFPDKRHAENVFAFGNIL